MIMAGLSEMEASRLTGSANSQPQQNSGSLLHAVAGQAAQADDVHAAKPAYRVLVTACAVLATTAASHTIWPRGQS